MINISLHIRKLPPAKREREREREGERERERERERGYSGVNLGQLKSEVFILGGGVLWNQIPEQGCSREFGHKFTV